MKRVNSPLRYPGSKLRMAEIIAALMERNLLVGSHLYEPFAGGGAISLSLLANNFVQSATWIERDPLIYSFWQVTKSNPDELIDRMMRSKITINSWRRMQSLREIDRPTSKNINDLAYGGLFFNRTCFSGIIGAGPIGGISQKSQYKVDCRFNKKELAKSIREVSELLKKVEIRFGDGVKFLSDYCLKMATHSLVYIDPPYVTNGYKLYRYHFEKEHHEALADAIGDLRTPWLLSYDNHELIRELYVGEQAKFVKTYQSLKGARFVKEILLLSEDFELPANERSRRAPRARLRAGILDYDQ